MVSRQLCYRVCACVLCPNSPKTLNINVVHWMVSGRYQESCHSRLGLGHGPWSMAGQQQQSHLYLRIVNSSLQPDGSHLVHYNFTSNHPILTDRPGMNRAGSIYRISVNRQWFWMREAFKNNTKSLKSREIRIWRMMMKVVMKVLLKVVMKVWWMWFKAVWGVLLPDRQAETDIGECRVVFTTEKEMKSVDFFHTL